MNIIIRRDPTETLASLVPLYEPMGVLDEIEELARKAWGHWEPVNYETRLLPRTEMHEENGQVVIKAELPGMQKKGLDITLEGNTLTIKAEKKQEKREKGDDKTSHIREQYYEQYVRSISLPFPVDSGTVSATFKRGVLELRLPKTEESKPKRIKVKVEIPQLKKPGSTTPSSK